MLRLTRTGLGLLTRQYRSVLRKCWLINVGLWQTMGDAVSKAVSVPARLIASLFSGGTMNGESFSVLDEILLNRLFERKLATLTAIGLGIAAATMPSTAAAETYPVHDVAAEQTVDVINDAFTNNTIESTTGAYVKNAGTIKLIDTVVSKNTHNTSSGFSDYIYNTGTINDIVGYYLSNTVNSTTGGNADDGLVIGNFGTIGTIDAVFNNSAMKSDSTSDNSNPVGAVYNAAGGRITNVFGSFLGNYVTSGTADSTYGVSAGALVNSGTMRNVDATFIGNYAENTGSTDASGGSLYNKGSITSLEGAFINNYA